MKIQVLSLLVLGACAGDPPPPATNAEPVAPAPAAPAAAAPASTTTVAAQAPEVPPPAATTAEPAKPPVKVQLADVAKVEVLRGKTKTEISKPGAVSELVKAVGPEQVADGAPRSKCNDEVTLMLKDKAGADKGKIAFCNVEGLGAEYEAAGERKGFKVADEATVRKVVGIKPVAPAPAITAPPKVAPPKVPTSK